jgi:Rieske [2Fe-2S] domain
VTFTPKWKFDAVLAAIVAAWFIGGRALFRSVDLDVFLVQATAMLAFLFLSAAISVGPLSRLWSPATHFIYNRQHLGVATWALAVSHAAVVMHYGNSWKPANVLEVLPGQKVAGVPFTHQNGPLGEGRVRDGYLECPWHGYQFDPCTGLGPPGFTDSVPTYELVHKGKQTYLRLPAARRASGRS